MLRAFAGRRDERKVDIRRRCGGKLRTLRSGIAERGIADDRVIDTVNLFSLGLMEENTALSLLSQHQPNNQICILNQEVIEKCLSFKEVIVL